MIPHEAHFQPWRGKWSIIVAEPVCLEHFCHLIVSQDPCELNLVDPSVNGVGVPDFLTQFPYRIRVA